MTPANLLPAILPCLWFFHCWLLLPPLSYFVAAICRKCLQETVLRGRLNFCCFSLDYMVRNGERFTLRQLKLLGFALVWHKTVYQKSRLLIYYWHLLNKVGVKDSPLYFPHVDYEFNICIPRIQSAKKFQALCCCLDAVLQN